MPPNNLCCKQMFDSFLERIFDRRWRSISYKVIKVFIEIVSYVACELQWQIKYFGIFLTFESKWEPSNPQLVTWIIYLDVWWDTFLSVHYILYSSHFQRLKRNWTFDWKLSGQAFFSRHFTANWTDKRSGVDFKCWSFILHAWKTQQTSQR